MLNKLLTTKLYSTSKPGMTPHRMSRAPQPTRWNMQQAPCIVLSTGKAHRGHNGWGLPAAAACAAAHSLGKRPFKKTFMLEAASQLRIGVWSHKNYPRRVPLSDHRGRPCVPQTKTPSAAEDSGYPHTRQCSKCATNTLESKVHNRYRLAQLEFSGT
jgi:hypothetical protein